MVEAMLCVSGLCKSFGALKASDMLELEVARGEIHGLIGPNGAGKTTAMAQIFGEITPDAGSVRFDGADITRLPTPARARRGLQRSYQITSVFPSMTVEDNVALAVQARSGSSMRFWTPARRDAALREPAREVLTTVGLGDRAGEAASDLAHGEQRQLELAMVLATRPRMLLLDEPMAGMGQEESRRMTEILLALKGDLTILLVEHDMDVVFALADRISVLVKGRRLTVGAPDDVRANLDVRRAYLGDY